MKAYNWIKYQVIHKLHYISIDNLKKISKEHGLALLVIIVGWEVIEDIIFPMIFWQLGHHVNPAFFAGIPASIIICLHWLAVPFLWTMWMKLSGRKEEINEHICSHGSKAKENKDE